MATQYVKKLCIEMPLEFPAAEFDTFMDHTGKVLIPQGDAQVQLGGTPNIIGFRFRQAAESLKDFSASWNEYGDAHATHEVLYQRDRALFGFFSAGVSCIEATCYAIYAVASDPNTLGVPFGSKEQRKASPAQLRAALSKGPSTKVAALLATLDTLEASSEWETWVSFRNRQSHRSNLPRVITAVIGAPLPPTPPIHLAATSSTKAFAGSVEDLEGLLAWLAATQKALLVGGTEL